MRKEDNKIAVLETDSGKALLYFYTIDEGLEHCESYLKKPRKLKTCYRWNVDMYKLYDSIEEKHDWYTAKADKEFKKIISPLGLHNVEEAQNIMSFTLKEIKVTTKGVN